MARERRVRVLHLVDGLGTGGTEQSLLELLPALRRRGVDAVVACFEHRTGAEQEILAHGFEMRFIAARRLPGRVRALRRLLAELEPDVLQVSHLDSELVGRFGAVGRDVVVLTSLVNDRYHPVRHLDPNVTPWKLALLRRLDGWTARHLCDHFHAVSASTKDAAVAQLGVAPERITVVERGRDPRRFRVDRADARRRVRQELGIADDVPLLLNLGREEYQKGQRHLLAALAELRRGGSRAVALICGRPGRASGELDTLTRELDLASAVHRPGHRDDVPSLLAAADLLVFPSLYEGMPGAVLEAMAMETPVVASDIAPVRDVVEDGAGLLVSPGSPGELAAAVAGLLADPARARRLGRRGGEIFAERFTLDRAVEGMRDLYLHLTATARRHR